MQPSNILNLLFHSIWKFFWIILQFSGRKNLFEGKRWYSFHLKFLTETSKLRCLCVYQYPTFDSKKVKRKNIYLVYILYPTINILIYISYVFQLEKRLSNAVLIYNLHTFYFSICLYGLPKCTICKVYFCSYRHLAHTNNIYPSMYLH